VAPSFTASHRGGCGAPLVLLHGFTDRWRAATAPEMIAFGLRGAYSAGLDAERIACPVRIVWGAEHRLLPWPSAAARYRDEWLPHADWVQLDGVGHCPPLDVPLETAQLILGFADR
jgi:pimeloyl-ACP methyl ester carboxylesterase